jgi:hypothetical protein
VRGAGSAYLCNHHMAVKGPLSIRARGTLNVWADLGNNRGAESHVGNKVTVHDVDLCGVSDMTTSGCSREPYV